jgi:hypothetical protein
MGVAALAAGGEQQRRADADQGDPGHEAGR